MSTSEILIERDTEHDILYVLRTAYQGKVTTNIMLNADLTVRRDISSGEVVGFTIEDFSKVMPHLSNLADYLLMEKFDGIIEFANVPGALRV